jgi:nucleotide-binding universal stress UspA family protein
LSLSEEELKLEAEQQILQLKNEILQKTVDQLSIQTEVKMGTFFPQLEEVCERTRPYAVVMGSQGTTAAKCLLFGGHTVHAMQHLMWKLITVPPGAVYASVKKVALACDLNHLIDRNPSMKLKP